MHLQGTLHYWENRLACALIADFNAELAAISVSMSPPSCLRAHGPVQTEVQSTFHTVCRFFSDATQQLKQSSGRAFWGGEGAVRLNLTKRYSTLGPCELTSCCWQQRSLVLKLQPRSLSCPSSELMERESPATRKRDQLPTTASICRSGDRSRSRGVKCNAMWPSQSGL